MSTHLNNAVLTPWGGAGLVTGANFLLELASLRLLVDCGLEQDGADPDTANHAEFGYEPSSIDALFVTHAHMDHIGRIPLLVKRGFRGRILSTPETKALARLMLEDAARVFADRYHRRETTPLYRQQDVEAAFSLWEEEGYREPIPMAHGLFARFLDAGHILGSAMVEVAWKGDKIVFTGDLGNSPSPLLCDTERVEDAKYLVMESVYGDRNHETREARKGKLAAAVKDIAARKGVLIIPAFSLERTQVILSELNDLVEAGAVPAIPTFLDSPLSIRVTEIYRRMRENWNSAIKARLKSGDDPFEFPRLSFTPDRDDSARILAVGNPKIIIAGSGMSNGGRVVRHEQVYLPDRRNMLLLVGYQSPGTMGRRIADGAREVEIDGERVPVRAEIRQIEGYSSHKGCDELVSFVEATADTLEVAFLGMGEPKSSLFLAQRLADYLGVKAVVPRRGASYPLSFSKDEESP